jgi:hypothetical protein
LAQQSCGDGHRPAGVDEVVDEQHRSGAFGQPLAQFGPQIEGPCTARSRQALLLGPFDQA